MRDSRRIQKGLDTLPETIDWPQEPNLPRRSRRGLLIFLVVIAVLVFGSRTGLSAFCGCALVPFAGLR